MPGKPVWKEAVKCAIFPDESGDLESEAVGFEFARLRFGPT
jgi:hypothetical protein